MAELICPHCGVRTSFSAAPVIGKGILLDKSSGDSTVRGEVQISAIFPYSADYGDDAYAIVWCQGCGECFVVKKDKYTRREQREWSAVYPIQHKVAPDDIPEPIKSEFEEANLCYAIGAFRACISMCQIALEHVWHEQSVSGLAELKDKGIIPARFYDRANEIRLWGNLEKHQLVIEPVSPEDAEQLLGYLEILLNEAYVEPKHLDELAKKRKELKKGNSSGSDK